MRSHGPSRYPTILGVSDSPVTWRESPGRMGFRRGIPLPRIADVTITIETGSLDESGRLVHADDAIAQVCLALVRLESRLDERGLDASRVTQVRVHAVEPRCAGDLVGLVIERFEAVSARPLVTWVGETELEPPGLLVRLAADIADHPANPATEGTT